MAGILTPQCSTGDTMEYHDLTTKSGFKASSEWLKQYGWLLNPAAWIIWKLLSPEITTEKQVALVKELISAGRNNNVNKMRIKVSHQTGIDLGTNVDGTPVSIKAGNNGCVDLEVEFS
jgi:hypothetical protein